MNYNDEKCCGACCWFKDEDIYGMGLCSLKYAAGSTDDFRPCDHLCDDFFDNKQMRHYMAVLLQANRYRRDQNVPSIYKMPNPTELGKAIDFALEYMKVFSDL